MSPKLKKIIKWTLAGLLLLCLIPFTFFLFVYFGAFGKVYSGEELKNLQNYLASDVYSSDGKLIGSYYWENRSNTDYKHIPGYLVSALIATEDARFYEHNGVDTKGLLRVFFKTLLMREKNAGGGSTIAQQLAKNLLKRQDHGFLTMPVNKIKEAIHAVRFNKVYSQEEILALYLNTVSVGEDTYGIKNAALRFFNRPPDSLKIEECAVLVGMLKSPTHYNPRTHPENALARRNVVIDNMALHHYLRQPVADSLKKTPLKLDYRHSGAGEGPAPFFIGHLEQLLSPLLDSIKNPEGKKYSLYTDGLKVYTTLNSVMQSYATTSIKKHMRFLQTQFDGYWKKQEPWGKNTALVTTAMKNTSRYKALKEQGMNEPAIEKIFQTPVGMDLFDWDGGHTSVCSPMDSIKYCAKLLQTGFLALDPADGEVKVWIGGDDFGYFQYDHIKAKRQVGSTFKPIVYATALEQGMSPCDYIHNEKSIYEEYAGWSPENSDGKYGGKYSLTGALSNSVNAVSVEVLLRAGIAHTIHTAHSMGIESEILPVPSIALGVADISLEEMVKAYCVFANGGKKIEPWCIARIEDRNGKVIYSAHKPAAGKQVISKQTAFYLCGMLKSVVNAGTAHDLRGKYAIKGEIAGKTGTTQSQADGWFIGFTPGLVAGVWVGAESPSVHFNNLMYGQGAHTALPIWGLFMQKCKTDKRCNAYLNGSFRKSPGLEELPQCEPYVKDNVFGKLRSFFRNKKVKKIEKKKMK